ncbi:hypothetical protein PQ610_00805 [Tardisphaera miroshnichenkoae]
MQALFGLQATAAQPAEGAGWTPPPSSVSITVENPLPYAVEDFPVFVTVYFSEYEVSNLSLVVFSSTGAQVPCQILNYALYPNGDLESAELVFQSSAQPGSNSTYYVAPGKPAAWQNVTAIVGDRYDVQNGNFSFYQPRRGGLGLIDLEARGQSSGLASLPALTFQGPGANQSAFQLNASTRLLVNGPEMSIIQISAVAPVSYVVTLTAFRGFPLLYYSIRLLNSTGEWRPELGYLNSSVFTSIDYPTGRTLSSSISFSGLVLPPSQYYVFSGSASLFLSINSTYQYLAAANDPPMLAFACVGSSSTFSAVLGPGVSYGQAGEMAALASRPPEVVVHEPPVILSIAYPSSVEVFQDFPVTLRMYFPSSITRADVKFTSEGLNVASPGISELKEVSAGSWCNTTWVLYANRTGNLNGTFLVNGTSIGFITEAYVQSLFPYVSFYVRVMTSNVSVGGARVMLQGMGLTSSRYTNSSGFAEFNMPMGVYSATVYRGSSLLSRTSLEVLGSGIYYVSTQSLALAIYPEFENGAPILPPSSPLFVLYNGTGAPVQSSTCAYRDGKLEAVFSYLPPGSYYVVGMMWNIKTKPVYVNLTGSEALDVVLPGLQSLSFKVLSSTGGALANATVQLFGTGGLFLSQGVTNDAGEVSFAVPAANYSYSVTYKGAQVAQGSVGVSSESRLTVLSDVSLTTVSVRTPFGPAEGVTVSIYAPNGALLSRGVTNQSGAFTVYLPSGEFIGYASSPLYSASFPVKAPISKLTVSLGFSEPFMILILLCIVAWAGYVSLELRVGSKKEEIKKISSMIKKLDELYSEGEVKYPLYMKLRDEYEQRLKELVKHEE